MNKMLLSALILSISLSLEAQVIKQEIKASKFTGAEYIAAGDSFLFASINYNRFYTQLAEQAFLYKFDFNLNVLDSVKLNGWNLGQSDFFYPSDIEVDSGGNVYSLHLYYKSASSAYCGITSYILVHNSSLSLIDSISLDVDTLSENFIEILLYDRHILATGGASVCGTGLVRPAIFNYDLTTKTGRLVRFDTLGLPNSRTYFHDVARTTDGFIVRAEGPVKVTQNKSWGNVGLDSSFNVTTIGSFSEKNSSELRALRGTGAYVPVSEDSIYQLSVAWAWPQHKPPGALNYQNFGYSLLDSANNVCSIDTLPLCGFNCSLDPYDLVQASWDAYDYTTTDSVLFVQMERYVNSDNFYLKDTVPFYIYNFNGSKGRMNWIRKIERNYTCGGHAVAALPGNRWAISFNEYNWDKYPGENLSVHIWILNGKGDIISQREFTKSMEKIKVFPNPARDYITVDLGGFENGQHSEFKLMFYDGQGREQYREMVTATGDAIDVSSWEEGVYTCQLLLDSQPVAVGKVNVKR